MAAMATSPDKQSLKTFLADTVTLLCRNFLHFESEVSIEGLIGITLDQKDVFLISIHETLKSPDAAKVIPAPKSAEAEIPLAKSTPESIIAACAVTLAQSVTSVEDDVRNTPVSRNSTDVEMLRCTNVTAQPVARQLVARQPVVLLPDDVKKGDDSPTDVKLEVSSVRSIVPEPANDGKAYDRNLSSRAEQSQNCDGLQLGFGPHETGTCDDLKTLQKLDYSSSGGEVRLSYSSSVAEHSTSPRAGFLQSGDFEVIEIKEESLSEDEFTVSVPNSQLELPTSQLHSQDFSDQGMSSAMDTSYSYWEGNHVNATQAMNHSTISVTSSASNPGDIPPMKRGPKTKKWKFYECLKCGSKLTTAYGLKKHDTVIHQGNYEYTCHICGKGLRTEYNLRGHMASRHNMRKDYRCTMCAREFGYRHTLRDHMIACHGHAVIASVDMENSDLGT